RTHQSVLSCPTRRSSDLIHHLETGEIEPVQRDLRALRQHVAAIGGEAQLQQAAGEARAFVDDRKEAARGHIEPLQSAAQDPDRLDRKSTRLNSSHEWISY